MKRIAALAVALLLAASSASGVVMVKGWYSDSFTRSNETPMASPWSVISAQAMNLTSNHIVGSGSEWNNYAFRSETFGANQWSEQKYTGGSISGEIGGPIVRASANVSGDFNGYFVTILDNTTAAVYVVWGDPQEGEQVGSNITSTFTTNDSIRINIVGNVITVFKNGASIGSVTDSSNRISSGGAPGVMSYGSVATWDDWKGGAL